MELDGSGLHLLPLTERVPAETVLGLYPDGPIIACDFYVEDIEQGEEVVGGYRLGRILNVDHHAPTNRMRRRVSSANLALRRAETGLLEDDIGCPVVLNHIDCDSVLSGGIMAGVLDPDPRYGAAAIAADHTGDEDPVADLLQAVGAHQSNHGVRDLGMCFRNLERLIRGERLEPFASEALDIRTRKRAKAERLVRDGAFRNVGLVSYAVLEERIDSEFFPALMQRAVIILTMNPLPSDTSLWQVKARLGMAAPSGLSLSDLRIADFDPGYGGRWNAGSNRRGGGTALDPESYAAEMADRAAAAIKSLQSEDSRGRTREKR